MAIESRDVLVVDDDKHLTEFLRNFFSKMNYRMRVVLSGEEALKAVEQDNLPSCCLICDCLA